MPISDLFFSSVAALQRWAVDKDGAGDKIVVRKEQKSVKLLVRIIETFTDPKDIICDPFMGTGTTLIAALYCGRSCFGMDSDPNLIAVVNERLEMVSKMLGEGKSAEVLNM